LAGTALHLTPDAALILFTLGVLLIFIELNRPGAILPGAFGLLLTLLSTAALLRLDLTATGLVLVFTAIVLLLLGLFRPTPVAVPVAAIFALCLGFGHIVAGSGHAGIHAFTAIACGIVLGTATSVLTRVARRARANKALD
jgi:membrane-bound serine protease (ClpP class)